MLDGRVLEASQVEYNPFGKPPLQREGQRSWGPSPPRRCLHLGAAGLQATPAPCLRLQSTVDTCSYAMTLSAFAWDIVHLRADAGETLLLRLPVDAALGTLNWAFLPEGAYTGARLAAWISSNFATATYSKTTNSLSVAYDGNRLILNDLTWQTTPPRRPPLPPSPSAWTTRLGPSFGSSARPCGSISNSSAAGVQPARGGRHRDGADLRVQDRGKVGGRAQPVPSRGSGQTVGQADLVDGEPGVAPAGHSLAAVHVDRRHELWPRKLSAASIGFSFQCETLFKALVEHFIPGFR